MIAGEANGKRACFPSTQDVLKTGLLPGFGIRGIAVAGHPEGHPEMSRAETFEVLAQKQALADSQGLNMRIVTQFSFDPDQVLAWSRKLVPNGISAPVHVGLAPARARTAEGNRRRSSRERCANNRNDGAGHERPKYRIAAHLSIRRVGAQPRLVGIARQLVSKETFQ